MAAPLRRTDPSLEDILLERPWDFDFFQAVRVLGLMNSDRRLIARLGQPVDNIVRFHAHLSMYFPPSSIQDLQPDVWTEVAAVGLGAAALGLAVLAVLAAGLVRRRRRPGFAVLAVRPLAIGTSPGFALACAARPPPIR